ncbi:cobalamin B12-binding domain-containing protein [Planomonospora parontospora]|uniref:cobalamin B12-binding domain-containing protein n=1 Tax=Planomonospora parontospora TaxID=58119 RepID=UPI0035A23E7F
MTVACADGEYHALPTRLLAEVLRLRGWHVDFLGAGVPGPHLITHLHQAGPDTVALSCTLPTRLPRAHATIAACRAVGVPSWPAGAASGPVDDASLFTEFVGWTAGVLRARGVPLTSLAAGLAAFGRELRDFPRAGRMLAEAAAACQMFDPSGGTSPGSGGAGTVPSPAPGQARPRV